MTDRDGLLDSIADFFMPIHRDGHKFIGAGLAATLVLFLLWAPLGWLAALATAGVAFVFRDPDRVTPLREGLVVAPADGRVLAVDRVSPPQELGMEGAERVRIAIHLSMLDVHITRAPSSGRITGVVYIPGTFASVRSDKASEDNERRGFVIELESGAQMAVVQIAGGWRRRLIAFVGQGARVGAGERLGLIRFGSRVDLYLPAGAGALVAVGQTMVGGETVVADLTSPEVERSARIV